MNKVTRRKLGLGQSDAKVEADKILNKISEISPISADVNKRDFIGYAAKDIKTINVGTLRKPVEKLAVYDSKLEAYIPIELNIATNRPVYSSESNYEIALNGELLNYSTSINVDQNNPYDPLFASFERLYSLPPQTFIQSGVTGVRIGEKEKYFNIMSGFNQSTIVIVSGAGSDVNGTFTPTVQLSAGRPVYINSSIPFPAHIAYQSGAGWVIYRGTIPGRIGLSLASVPSYLSPSTGMIPTGNNWVITGRRALSGVLPVPSSTSKDFEGFFKLATTRKSNDKKRLYATPVGETGVITGSISGQFLPLGASWVPYPHTYNVENYGAFRYPVSITFEEDGTGINDLIVISTGDQSKKVVYVSPHRIEQFQGFWSEQTPTSRVPVTGANGNVISFRNIWTLGSGNLLTVASESTPYTGLNFVNISGISGSVAEFYNFENSVLKQNTPLSNTVFYKLYEAVYRKNSINTGTWNGIIPSGTPFSIEIVRTKNSELYCPKLGVHVVDTFVNVSPSGSGQFQYLRPFNYEDFAGVGFFKGYSQMDSENSKYEANYFAENDAKKKAKSKLKGYLWEKGLTVDNSKVKKVVKLFGTPITPSGVPDDGIRYCLPYDNPSDPASCSYTGVKRGIPGVPTSAGLRLIDKDSNLIRNIVDEEGNVIKFIPVLED